MPISIHYRMLWPLILAAVHSATAFAAEDDCAGLTRQQYLEWRSERAAQTVGALDVHWSAGAGWVHRTLVEGVSGGPVALTQRFGYEDGVVSTEWDDSGSGWSARLDLTVPLEGDSLLERRESLFAGSGYSRARLTFSTGFEYLLDLTGSPREEAEAIRQLFLGLEAESRLAEAAGEVPASQVDQILFLEANLGRPARPVRDEPLFRFDGFQTRPIVDLLATLVRTGVGDEHLPSRGELRTWQLVSDRAATGRAVSDPRAVDLLSLFEGLENVDPLSDLDLESFRDGECRGLRR